MKYKIYTTEEIFEIEADDIMWGNGVVQFSKKISSNPNSIIQVNEVSKPIVAFCYNNLIRVDYLHEEK